MASEISNARLMGQLEMMRARASQEVGGLEKQAEDPTASAFASLLRSQVDSVNSAQSTAKSLAQDFELGTPGVELADVMIAAQKSRVQFEALTEVRNKLISAYQEIMSMQV